MKFLRLNNFSSNAYNSTGDGAKEYTYDGLQDGQTYWIRVVVEDNAGNTGKSAGDTETGTPIATPSANTPPYNLTTSAPTNLRSTTSLTITASATDREQSTLSYALYFNGSYKQTVSGERGSTVTFNAISGLSEATNYIWYVTVADEMGGSAKIEYSAFTNCSGKGNFVACSVCKGVGYIVPDCGNNQYIYEKQYGGTLDPCKHCGVTTSGSIWGVRCTSCLNGANALHCSRCGGIISFNSGAGFAPCGACGGTGGPPAKCKHALSAEHYLPVDTQ